MHSWLCSLTRLCQLLAKLNGVSNQRGKKRECRKKTCVFRIQSLFTILQYTYLLCENEGSGTFWKLLSQKPSGSRHTTLNTHICKGQDMPHFSIYLERYAFLLIFSLIVPMCLVFHMRTGVQVAGFGFLLLLAQSMLSAYSKMCKRFDFFCLLNKESKILYVFALHSAKCRLGV